MTTNYCYILKNSFDPHSNRTYNGYTNNPSRRIRQHNGEIKGGAKYTKKYGNCSWEIYAIVKGFPDNINALQCEWRIKHPNNRRRLSRKYCSPRGRIVGLNEVLKLEQWTNNSTINNEELTLTVWITAEYSNLLTDLPENVTINILDKIDPRLLE